VGGLTAEEGNGADYGSSEAMSERCWCTCGSVYVRRGCRFSFAALRLLVRLVPDCDQFIAAWPRRLRRRESTNTRDSAAEKASVLSVVTF